MDLCTQMLQYTHMHTSAYSLLWCFVVITTKVAGLKVGTGATMYRNRWVLSHSLSILLILKEIPKPKRVLWTDVARKVLPPSSLLGNSLVPWQKTVHQARTKLQSTQEVSHLTARGGKPIQHRRVPEKVTPTNRATIFRWGGHLQKHL